jgi:predicted ester cyclase
MTIEEQAIRKAVDFWNNGDLEGYLRLYDERIKLHASASWHSSSGPVLDKAGVRATYEATWATMAADGSSGPHLDIIEVVASGQRLAHRFVMSGVHKGLYMGIAATGKPYQTTGMTFLHFDGEKCIERWTNFDTFGMLTQLGATIPPPAARKSPAS